MCTDFEGCPNVQIVVAVTPKNGIGLKNNLPWPHIKKDFLFLSRITNYIEHEVKKKDQNLQNVVIFGRNTYFSLPPSAAPLKNRINVVISKTVREIPGVLVYETLPLALKKIQEEVKYNKIFILGGSYLYKEAIDSGLCEKIYLTRIAKNYEADVFFPQLPDSYEIVGISKTFGTDDTTFDFVIYEKKNVNKESELPDLDKLILTGEKLTVETPLYKACPSLKIRYNQELQYLDILADILNNGTEKPNRTGINSIAKFGYQMRFDLSESFPLLTTKKVFLRGIIEELIWFIRGSTNGNELLEKNVRIWELNGAREFLDNLGFVDREEHDLGPVYGFQWRHFGAKYVNMHTDYTGQGIDQLSIVIDRIKNNPNDRRLIVCSWNVSDLSKMALPPCHLLFQFFVADGRLSCMMHQRSCDMGLGVPFNIASYALLTCMMAQICELKPGEFVHNLGDAHIYSNHIDAMKEQISRIPYPFPTLRLNKDITRIEDFTLEDVKVENYLSHPAIKMDMAA
ncbi:dihydrofolate reductase/thymidilate synthase, putative [Theileria equi strain WA]|uniref:Bifunctional dihydrofolate reductase-thymidylate synthase n=1 Tax=Theileria equi strain WA TaxID=1537102 RepID=L0B0P3_THEEQ|nr:dihydrofolate reductase/thymidilate synthase, putative [Theileria equi strain WA]AFZ81407.1 dihydrofolate reductase/thymidilate synthase, putative [Theileria equi strain WA]|eukprot:XP_004831073.1 dihydrofolate reductase/thymidilate synthase, putative [Theileria equi strain WA]